MTLRAVCVNQSYFHKLIKDVLRFRQCDDDDDDDDDDVRNQLKMATAAVGG